ncbi:squalene synthase HpnC [Entomobacter blattae]|uniref:Hydroxysqualene synthase n=1 Tax=Entomobacter blattae TaxID=2762277 RepID=A0A7H1NPF2_9PROT|nr:squalene synthase HpnC [Entomobacter blattae]QNT77662.1 Hydroxysqualene synthase [Entomobacter blattae]
MERHRSQNLKDNPWGREDVTSTKTARDENFPVGSWLIDQSRRPFVHAYYQFARVADDISDSSRLSPEEKIARLNALEDVVLGRVSPPLSRTDAASAVALAQQLKGSRVQSSTATDLLIAFRQDSIKLLYANWYELLEYCRYSANPVGRFLLQLHGEKSAVFAYSDALCTALQVLNHLQDCKKDWKNLGRCYIPQDWMAEEGVKIEDVLADYTSVPLRLVFNRMLDEVDAFNRQASLLLGVVRNRRMRLESAVIVSLSKRLASRLRNQDPLAGRVKLTKLDFAMAALKALRWLSSKPS